MPAAKVFGQFFASSFGHISIKKKQDPILLNSQLQRQRCRRPERFSKQSENFCFQNALGYPWSSKFFTTLAL
jgi:hypothetical protein